MSWQNILKNDIKMLSDMIIKHWPNYTKFVIIFKNGEFRMAPNKSKERTLITMGHTYDGDKKIEVPKERRPFFLGSESIKLPINNTEEFLDKMKEMDLIMQDRPKHTNYEGETISRKVIISFELDKEFRGGMAMPAI